MYTCYFKYTNQNHKIRQLYYGICLLDHLNRMTIHIFSGLFICVLLRTHNTITLWYACRLAMCQSLQSYRKTMPFEELRNTVFKSSSFLHIYKLTKILDWCEEGNPLKTATFFNWTFLYKIGPLRICFIEKSYSVGNGTALTCTFDSM